MMSVGNHNSVEYTPLNNIRYQSRVQSVLVFYEGAQPKEAYVQLGLIEVQGKRMATTSDLLQNLKYKALAVGADAVVNVKKSYKTRKSGHLQNTFIDNNSERQTYESIVMQGLAVRFNNIDNLEENERTHLHTKDRAMHSYIKSEKRQNESDDGFDIISTILIWIVAIAASLS